MLGRNGETYDSLATGVNLDDGDIYDLAGVGGVQKRNVKVSGGDPDDIYDLAGSGSIRRGNGRDNGTAHTWDTSQYAVDDAGEVLARTGEYLDLDQVGEDGQVSRWCAVLQDMLERVVLGPEYLATSAKKCCNAVNCRSQARAATPAFAAAPSSNDRTRTKSTIRRL